MPTKTKTTLVRYVSPFGSPAPMLPVQAEHFLAEDKRLWELMEEAGLLDERMLRIGEPRIDDDDFHLSDMPVFETPGGDSWATIRAFVRKVEQRRRDERRDLVVIENDGRYAITTRSLVLGTDRIVWPLGT